MLMSTTFSNFIHMYDIYYVVIIKHGEIQCYLMIFVMIIMMILHMEGNIML